MRAVVTRVLSASCTVEDKLVGSCGHGLLVLVAAGKASTNQDATRLADRVAGLRIFSDESGKMNLPLPSAVGQPQLLVVSNFTLYGDAWASRRPSFTSAAPYAEGERLYETFVNTLRALGLKVDTGVFGTDMKLTSINDGPVTLVIDC